MTNKTTATVVISFVFSLWIIHDFLNLVISLVQLMNLSYNLID